MTQTLYCNQLEKYSPTNHSVFLVPSGCGIENHFRIFVPLGIRPHKYSEGCHSDALLSLIRPGEVEVGVAGVVVAVVVLEVVEVGVEVGVVVVVEGRVAGVVRVGVWVVVVVVVVVISFILLLLLLPLTLTPL